ncbi:DUF2490 domain-containing protein [Pedobacter aquatilis]|uniref:DUF2490 domain-containing protein n=1 Tax=Pedobacter aquatilis TaxID=351343 RepID=UPI002930862F|nr:DUF2490 domain-containing protein [Pedobacter aquatilis]
MRKSLLLAIVLIMVFGKLSAQTQHQNTGWFMFVNNTKFNEKWGLHFDFQLRTADDWVHTRNILIRPGITYYVNRNQNVTLGYLLTQTYNPEFDFIDVSPGVILNKTANEHRIWEQYIINHKIKSGFATHRFRLEQRFVQRSMALPGVEPDFFAQRFRYFFRLIQPLQKTETNFTKGAFVALQNEVFLNLQNKSELNGNVFDQNRAYLAVGYRFSKQFDIEAGYMNQATKGRTSNMMNNIIQLAVYTRF